MTCVGCDATHYLGWSERTLRCEEPCGYTSTGPDAGAGSVRDPQACHWAGSGAHLVWTPPFLHKPFLAALHVEMYREIADGHDDSQSDLRSTTTNGVQCLPACSQWPSADHWLNHQRFKITRTRSHHPWWVLLSPGDPVVPVSPGPHLLSDSDVALAHPPLGALLWGTRNELWILHNSMAPSHPSSDISAENRHCRHCSWTDSKQTLLLIYPLCVLSFNISDHTNIWTVYKHLTHMHHIIFD